MPMYYEPIVEVQVEYLKWSCWLYTQPWYRCWALGIHDKYAGYGVWPTIHQVRSSDILSASRLLASSTNHHIGSMSVLRPRQETLLISKHRIWAPAALFLRHISTLCTCNDVHHPVPHTTFDLAPLCPPPIPPALSSYHVSSNSSRSRRPW